MKREHFITLAWPVSVAAALAACAGDDTLISDNDADAPDAQTVIDATAASSDAHPYDASIDDGAARDADAILMDAGPPGVVTIHAIDNSLGSRYPTTPVVGATVVFRDPDGTPHSARLTDDAGAASEVVLPGSSVTVSMPSPGAPLDRLLVSVVAIEPGDDLKVNTSLPLGGGAAPPETEGVTVDPPSGDAGALGVSHWGDGCEIDPNTGSSVPMGIGPGCIVDGSVNVLASIQGESGPNADPNVMTAFAIAQNISILDGGTEISDWSWTPATLMQPTLTGTMPTGATYLNITAELRLSSIIYAWETTGAAPVEDGGFVDAIRLGLPQPGLLDNIVYDLTALHSDSLDAFSDLIVVASPSNTLTVNLSDFPPHIVGATAAFDPGTKRATASWTADGPLTTLDGAWVQMDWTGASGHAYRWTVVAPAAASVTTPPLTSDLVPPSDFPTTTGAQALSFTGVWVQSIGVSHSYAAYRSTFGTYVRNTNYPSYDPLSPTPITFRQTTFYR